ncbi:High-affinity nitrate transporter 2.1 [Gonapodya sp. JEL0774]|nr:High-affinity nitrate transporter 2.1 [Gonapodya sp. JEL0774]
MKIPISVDKRVYIGSVRELETDEAGKATVSVQLEDSGGLRDGRIALDALLQDRFSASLSSHRIVTYTIPQEINLASFRRVHMRSFYLSTLGFFSAFTAWFAITAVLPSIKKDTGITDSSASTSDITNVASTVIFRFFVGPLVDYVGARRVMSTLLTLGSIPLMCAAFVNDGSGLIVTRFFVGLLGAVFVPCQYWTSALFSSNVIGSANALAAGWGNLGAGVTYLLTPQVYNLMGVFGVPTHYQWRVTLLVPACFCVLVALLVFFFGDDKAPVPGSSEDVEFGARKMSDGVDIGARTVSDVSFYNSETLTNDPLLKVPDAKSKRDSQFTAVGSTASEKKSAESTTVGAAGKSFESEAIEFLKLAVSPPVLVLMLMYACSFGVELSVDSKLGNYLSKHFIRDNCVPAEDANQCQYISQSTAGLLGSTFGLLNLFSRATGGILSDYFATKTSSPLLGRMGVQLALLFLNGVALLSFSFINSVAPAMVVLVLFSLFTEAACGSTYALVPFVDPERKGTVSGMVGAGGNIGGAIFNVIFAARLDKPSQGFLIMGIVVLVGSLSTFALSIQGTRGYQLLVRSRK